IDHDKLCLEGTRIEIIHKISQWICDTETNVPKIFFLHGPAGTGKSAIAHTIGKQCEDQGFLGAFFRFDRTFSTERTPGKALKSMAYNMAMNLTEFRNYLSELLNKDPFVAGSTSFQEQWEKLILKPAQLVYNTKPAVIIVDALDECGPQEGNGPRSQFISVIMEGTQKLPSNFRVLVTSRLENDILEVLTKYANQLHIQDMSRLEHVKEDIDKYVVHKMQRAIDSGNFTLDQCKVLAERAEEHFQWAFTVCKALYQEVKPGINVKQRFEKFMRLSADSSNSYTLLDQLYTSILEEVLDTTDDDAMKEYRNVTGQILAASEPVSKSILQSLQISYEHYLEEADNEKGVDAVISWLGSLFTGVNELNVPIQPVHTSVRDFLLDETRSKQFVVPIVEGNRVMGVGCIKLMTEQLHFNMCNLPSSHLRNSEVENLEELIQIGISPEMSYACCYWDIHFAHILCNNDMLNLMERFIIGYAFFWMEVLSLLKKIGIISRSMDWIIEWIKEIVTMQELCRDIKQCVKIFGKMMIESTPHLYVSAIPFLPVKSILSKVIQQQAPKVAKICKGEVKHWPAIQTILVGHERGINSVAFSQNGRRIVSGSDDGTVRIWDAEIGNALGKPLKGHNHWVQSVAFSPDGRRIVSGSQDCTPLKGHNSWVQSVAFSPDGRRIVSGSHDCTVRIWDAETGNPPGKPIKGCNQRVQSVAFSTDERRIVSGSQDYTVRIWDAETGNSLGKALEGPNDWAHSAAFSPDRRQIVSGSDHSTVPTQDAETE
ncbi:hypothetical protein GYMLUDRAFT_134386, partial [Collybiopsis luxurians FD-317 M1]